MDAADVKLCAHSGLLLAVMLGLGAFIIPGWLPPTSPSLDAQAVHDLFQRDLLRIRIGVTIAALSSVFWWSFSAAIAARMQARAPVLASLFVAAATGTVLAIMLPAFLWLVCAYRPTMSPETLQALVDLGWFMLVGAYPPIFLQTVVLARYVLTDRTERPAYPRWIGFLNVWTALLVLPGALIPFFKTGPFAWNGLICFWLVAAVFFGWIMIMWQATMQSLARDATA